jgi:hypothetical protein
MANLNSRDYVRGRRLDHISGASGSVELNGWNTNNSTTRPTLPTQDGDSRGVTVVQNTISRKDEDMNFSIGYKATGDV